MISVDEALVKVTSYFYRSEIKTIPIAHSLGYVLADDVYSLINMPPFPQSAMDGYALKIHDSLKYRIVGEVKAGDATIFDLKEGEAVRIFTGAPVPVSANAVVMQEKTTVEDVTIIIDESPNHQQNIRPEGEQIKYNELAIAKGTLLSPSAISFLVSLGVTKVDVYQKPKVGIVITGSELVSTGEPLSHGKIYESNSVLLANTLKKEGILDYTIFRVADNFKDTKKLLDTVTKENDFVLVSGGISVGDYDFVGKALQELKTEEIFYKIKQKPGKPLFFGKRNQCYVFALPGNPASALTCYYMYALPMLRFFCGNDQPHLPKVSKKMSHNYSVKGIRAQFLKAIVSGNMVSILSQQSSAMIAGFIEANAYVFVPEYTTEIGENELVEVILLP